MTFTQAIGIPVIPNASIGDPVSDRGKVPYSFIADAGTGGFWLLSKEGQELYAKVMRQSTRRIDIDTKWLQQHGVRAAKDVMTLEEYHRVRNHLEDKYTRVRLPAAKFAEQILR